MTEISNEAAGNWKVAGHDGVITVLRRSLTQPAQAYLFLGPRRVGKSATAVELAKALNCLSENLSNRPCQTCSECRLISKSGHPDVSVLEPNEKLHIDIEQVRRIRQEITLLPSQARTRVVILQADLLTEPAADALLKTLEEPPFRVVLILTGHDLDAIPDTIVSRCRTIAFGLVSSAATANELSERGVDSDVIDDLAVLAYGSTGWAIEAAENAEVLTRRREQQEDLTRWASESLLQRLYAAERLATAGGRVDQTRLLATEELELMMIWWRDVMLASVGRSELAINPGSRDEIEALATQQGLDGCARVLRAISTAATRIGENVDTRLALESLAVVF